METKNFSQTDATTNILKLIFAAAIIEVLGFGIFLVVFWTKIFA